MPRDSCESQPSVRLTSTDSLQSLLSQSLDADLLRPHTSECVSRDDSAFKGIQDLKSLMIKNIAPHNSLFIQNDSLSDLQNIPVQNSLGSLHDRSRSARINMHLVIDGLQHKKCTLPWLEPLFFNLLKCHASKF